MKAAVRCNALDMSELAAQEKHGKRQDMISKKRRMRDVSPIVYRTRDLRSAYDRHVEDVKMNKSAKKTVLHFIVRFPPELLDAGIEAGHFRGSKADRQKMMIRQAIQFINETHGGNAVFAARLDRDEAGETIVDVFATPVYEKRTKRTEPDKPGPRWASATKFGKELAEKHQDEIQRRHPGARGKLTSPRAVGIALQSEFADFFYRVNACKLDRKREKTSAAPDRLEKEAHDRIKAREREVEQRETKAVMLARRARAAVRAFSRYAGLPVPDRLSDALTGLESAAREVEDQHAVEDPFEHPVEDPFGTVVEDDLRMEM